MLWAHSVPVILARTNQLANMISNTCDAYDGANHSLSMTQIRLKGLYHLHRKAFAWQDLGALRISAIT
jgi:hypothetical protein